MGASAVIFQLRPPPPSFTVPARLLGRGIPSPCWSVRLLRWKPTKTWPPPRTTTARERARLEDSQGWKGVCRAHLTEDAPFAVAIGACILNSLVLPLPTGPDDEAEGGGGGIDSTDTRFAVMGILSLIPYFNWMSWIFAWLDTGSKRYLVYSIVYLAPYLRTNLSLSPNDSWLPIASILACIIHIQLEASIRNGDINGIRILEETLKDLFPVNKKVGSDPRRQKEILEEESKEMLGEGDLWRKSVDDLRQANEKDLKDEERN